MSDCSYVLSYSRDPAFRAAVDAERAVEQAKLNARIGANVAAYHARRAGERA